MPQPSVTPENVNENHLAALCARHAQLDRKIMEEQKRPVINGALVSHLKSKKLYLKEQIERLKDH